MALSSSLAWAGSNDVIVFQNAIKSGDLFSLESLIKYGNFPINVNGSYFEDDRTPLMESANLGHEKLVRYFLDMGADPGIKDLYGKSALDYAEENHFMQIAALLRSAQDKWNSSHKQDSVKPDTK